MDNNQSTLPYTIIHNMQSIDGRLTGFIPDLELYYGLAATFNEDATLVGSKTILAAPETNEETEEAFDDPQQNPTDPRGTLIIVDGKGQVRNWHMLKKAGIWRNFIALCTSETPKEYLDYLTKRHIAPIITGKNHVNLKESLGILYQKHNIKRIRVDSGGTLNGILLHEGLVDEISIIINPSLVGGTPTPTLFDNNQEKTIENTKTLTLTHNETLKNGNVWIRYTLNKNQ
jgi:2,5-diamino-6-(ribosylamino)-4(3H)-pyrimidinone 5'-phosphate reductase